jgi:hypothetical protein
MRQEAATQRCRMRRLTGHPLAGEQQAARRVVHQDSVISEEPSESVHNRHCARTCPGLRLHDLPRARVPTSLDTELEQVEVYRRPLQRQNLPESQMAPPISTPDTRRRRLGNGGAGRSLTAMKPRPPHRSGQVLPATTALNASPTIKPPRSRRGHPRSPCRPQRPLQVNRRADPSISRQRGQDGERLLAGRNLVASRELAQQLPEEGRAGHAARTQLVPTC